MFEELIDKVPFQVNNYKFTRVIGRGAFSAAFEVESDKYQTLFCGKATPITQDMLDESGNLCDMELYALFQLDHPNIIRLYNYFVSSGYLFLILELCQNGTLEDLITGIDYDITPSDVHKVAEGILQALKVCHEQRIAHRDIKPQNIFIDSYGRPKLADFGLSSFHALNQLAYTKCGSKAYAPPEMLQNDQFDPFKGDIWSLGVTLYQLATHRFPFPNGIKSNSILRFPCDMDSKLAKLIAKMMAFDPNVRPSAEELLNEPYFTNVQKPPRLANQRLGSFRSNLDIKDMTNVIQQQKSFRITRSSQLIMPAARRAAKNIVVEKEKRNSSILGGIRASKSISCKPPPLYDIDLDRNNDKVE